MGHAISYARGEYMAINQLEIEDQLEIRFPSYRTKESTEFEGLSAIVVSHEHTVQKYTCYAYGYQIGDDISHNFQAEFIDLSEQRLANWLSKMRSRFSY